MEIALTRIRPALRLARVDREIARLAVPALGALVAEPLFLLTDTALVGHLGAAPLAGLGVAGIVLQTALGLLIFLAYATTPVVARRVGAGDLPGAIRAGIDGCWFALVVGIVLGAAAFLGAPPLVAAFHTGPEVAVAASRYLEISALGLPAMLVVIAATGLLRGLQDTRTPLAVATIGFAANAGLNGAFIYGFGWGIAGSAWGTVSAQWGMALVYAVIAARAARRHGVSLRPGWDGIGRTASAGGWLLIRNAALRGAMLATVAGAATLGVTGLATVQIALTVFSTLAFALDALAIAGQAMIGHALGTGDHDRVRALTRRLVGWGVGSGAALGILLLAFSWLLAPVFTADPAVRALLPGLLVVTALGAPLAGLVFVLDGILLGAGDARYLAWTGVVNVAVYLPLLGWSLARPAPAATLGLWCAFGLGYLGARAATLGLRAFRWRWAGL